MTTGKRGISMVRVGVLAVVVFLVAGAVPAFARNGSGAVSSSRTGPTCGSYCSLGVVTNGPGTVTSTPAGINCGPACLHRWDYGTSVTLTATPGTGSLFSGWSGGGCSGTGNCTVSLTGFTWVTATFALIPETLTVTKSGTGTGTVASAIAGISCGATCSANFPYGTSVTLTATPGTNVRFDGWSGGGCSGTGNCTVPMTAAQSVTATFTKIFCEVPSLKGTTLANAKSEITGANCWVGNVTRKFSSTVKKGRVISQYPRPGTEKPNGSIVNIAVSRGTKP